MATKIQVRRDTTENWTTYGAEVPAAGEFCYDIDLKTLRIGDGTSAYRDLVSMADGDIDISSLATKQELNDSIGGIDFTDFVSKTNTAAQDIASNLTLGTDKITLDATDGNAEFAGGIDVVGRSTFQGDKIVIATDGTFQVSTDNANKALMLTSGYFVSHRSSPSATLYEGINNGSQVFRVGANGTAQFAANRVQFAADGSASFAGDIVSLSSNNTGNVTIGDLNFGGTDYKWAHVSQNGSTVLSAIKPDGSAEFAGRVNVGELEHGNALQGAGGYGAYISMGGTTGSRYGGLVVKAEVANANNGFAVVANGAPVYSVDYQGNAGFRNAIFNLEPDNDSNYVTTTDVDGNESRVYNGPVLDVKAVIQELQQRVADRDAVIASFATRLAQLEADHATLMGNSNGGY